MTTAIIREKGQPVHEVCKENVKMPRLFRKTEDGIVFLQWFGESDRFDLSGMQFNFPLNIKAETFFLKPERFEVIMIGPIKNWPNTPEVLAHMFQQLGGEDVMVIYCICSEIGIDGGNSQSVPAAGMFPVNIMLADDNCGLIKPKEFFDDSVRIKAIEKFQKTR
ncbi:MAG: hypothetical protein WC795_00995 [Candidatus Paceibacterota bacterium]|jgi:hypothetical protein